MNLKELQQEASRGDNTAMAEILNRYDRLVRKNSYVKGRFDEDHYQELSIQVMNCVKRFMVQEVHGVLEMLNKMN